MGDDNERRRAQVRSCALALGFLVLCLYVGSIVLTALGNSGSIG